MKRKISKIFLCIMLALLLVLGMTGCTNKEKPNDTPANEEASYKAGTYTATVKGHNGDLKVEVELNDTSIVSVKVLEHAETAGIGDAAIERIAAEITEDQTLAVDTVAGATVTSKAVLAAVEDCIKQAGGDVEGLKVKKDSDKTSDKETKLTTDIVIVGAGGTGLTAAASAFENGADVIVLEKLAITGGSTALSGGGISATDTKFQRELGITDTKESWMQLWKERQATSNPDSIYPNYDVVDKFMDEAVITTEWLADYVGHKYGSVEGYGVDFVKRIHFPSEADGKKGGAALIQSIENFVRKNNIEVMTETKATELITDEKGDVIGVVAEGKDGKIIINAKKVILAAGGFAKSEELLERFAPELAGTAELSAASAGHTGDGILMAEKVGAALYEDPWSIGLSFGAKVEGTSGLAWDWTKVLVNEKGERFINEETHYAIVTNIVSQQETPWLILDSSEANAKTIGSLEAALSSGEVVKADSYEELAKAMGVSEEVLAKTMADYNTGVKAGKDALGKSSNFLVAIEKAPYYALKIYPKTMGTFGGVKTNENFQVLREDGSIINNLYAGGECANRIMYNQVYMSGSAVQFAATSGRISGA
ncbi:MAG: fumarate reductase/succinate dehydrogenase flavoprotein domain protein, partial [Sedimentibacter sp.]|nr:fumarate reductase/succinate dehydrogenase flavoprotein domain protein [Sedimentibacter sp.]